MGWEGIQNRRGVYAKGGSTISVEIVLTLELEVLAIVFGGGGGAKSFHPLKGEAQKVLPCLAGGGGGTQTVLDLRFCHFVAPPLPVINDQSLGIDQDQSRPVSPLREQSANYSPINNTLKTPSPSDRHSATSKVLR